MTALPMLKAGHSCRRVELQGQRPSPLLLQRASHAIKKSPPRKPLVIHMVSPKVIHVPPGEFMSLVQRLTGAGSSFPPRPATTTTDDEASGEGELPSHGSSGIVEAARGPSRHASAMETDQPSSWYDFFMGQSYSAPAFSSGHDVLPSSGSYVDISCRVVKET